MSSFAQAFWSSDYAGGISLRHARLVGSSELIVILGLGVLFGKLQQGVQENQQFLTIAKMRADAEDTYGQHMGDIVPATDKIQGGFQKDDGASVRKVNSSNRKLSLCMTVVLNILRRLMKVFAPRWWNRQENTAR